MPEGQGRPKYGGGIRLGNTAIIAFKATVYRFYRSVYQIQEGKFCYFGRARWFLEVCQFLPYEEYDIS
jgi:hypothetical protein